jgi:hypothetical protein
MACTSIDWNAVGAVSTVAATLVALWLGMLGMWHLRKDAEQRDRDAKMRGRVALAMQVPEIARLVALFDRIEEQYVAMKQPGGNIRSHALRLGQLVPAITSNLKDKQIQDFLDMPDHLRYNLPTVIHALPAIAAYASQMKPRAFSAGADSKTMEAFLAAVDDALDYTRSCGVDFRAAYDYAIEHLMPMQHKNMKEHFDKQGDQRLSPPES